MNQDFLGWLSQNQGRPFFVFLNYYDAHEPYLPPQAFQGKFGTPGARRQYLHHYWMRHTERNPPGEEIQSEIDAYDDSIYYIDHEIGRLFKQLGEEGVLDNTVVINVNTG